MEPCSSPRGKSCPHGRGERPGTAKYGHGMESNYMEKDDLKFQTPLKKSSGKHIFLNGLPRNYVKRFSRLTSSPGVAGFTSIIPVLRLGAAGKSKTVLSS